VFGSIVCLIMSHDWFALIFTFAQVSDGYVHFEMLKSNDSVFFCLLLTSVITIRTSSLVCWHAVTVRDDFQTFEFKICAIELSLA
jgi:hypothetical protein